MELSIGQWQKVALARAFMRNAPILVLDEPTASLDARAECELFQRLRSLAPDRVVLFTPTVFQLCAWPIGLWCFTVAG